MPSAAKVAIERTQAIVAQLVDVERSDKREALIPIVHPYFSRGPWDERLGRIAGRIDAMTDWDEVAELVTDSYRQTAPKKVVALLEVPNRRIGNK